MEQKDAIQLITHNDFSTKNKKIWADLGCGSGTFTLALASILEADSIIHAIDTQESALAEIPNLYRDINIKKHILDFVKADLPIHVLDGVLMANSLHYVKDKEAFLAKLKSYLKPDANFLVIEYDSNISNAWVPYPIDFSSLHALFSKLGYRTIKKLNSRRSVYGNRQMYAALIES